LLDEIEKAHPDVFNILLQVLDDGRLTDGQGRTVDFRNTVIVMTSNLGSEIIQEFSQEGYAKMKDMVMEVVRKSFRPEFINRIDEAVVFHALGKDQIMHIAEIQIQRIKDRLKEHHYQIELSKEAVEFIATAGFDPVYGARPLKRAVQQYLENPLAQDILSGKFKPNDTIRVSCDSNGLVFGK
jgi:ATP-dependent Clp protease ATP-binding subunit ClpB